MTPKQTDSLLRNQLCDDCKHADIKNGRANSSGVVPCFRFCHKNTSPMENKNYVQGNCIVITMTCNRFEAYPDRKNTFETEDRYQDYVRGHISKKEFLKTP